MIPRPPSEILKEDCPIGDYIFLMAIIDVYKRVMRDEGRIDLEEKARLFQEKL